MANDLKHSVLEILTSKFLPSNEADATGHKTILELHSIIEEAINITPAELTEHLVQKGYILDIFENTMGFWVQEVL